MPGYVFGARARQGRTLHQLPGAQPAADGTGVAPWLALPGRMQRDVFDHVEVFYERLLQQFSLGCQAPVA